MRPKRLQIVILLSALLASLTGLVTGDRPIARTQVEMSMRTQADAPVAASRVAQAPAERNQVSARDRQAAPRVAEKPAPAPLPRHYLRLKRALLE